MQIARRIGHDFSNNVIEFKLKPIATKREEETTKNDDKKACFQTDERYFCKDTQCSCAKECKKLIAAWMR